MARMARTGSPTAKPIAGRRVDQALRQIVALIQDGQLPPGARLPGERQLAESVGVSRPILREALNRLEAKGLIERRSKSGNFVCLALPQALAGSLAASDPELDAGLISLGEVMELRRVLERWAVTRAIANADRKSVAELRAFVKTMETAAALRRPDDRLRYQEADMGFHQAIARMAKNLFYVHLLHSMADVIRRSIAATREILSHKFVRENLERHQALFAAIEARDPDAARRAVDAHFAIVADHLPS
jgi:GntR family transcriptional repressor for pyruvate dehydrogenase complex